MCVCVNKIQNNEHEVVVLDGLNFLEKIQPKRIFLFVSNWNSKLTT